MSANYIEFKDLTDETLGAYLYYCQLTTAILAELMNVNAYDQNGVENQKLLAKAAISDNKYDKEKNDYLLESIFNCIRNIVCYFCRFAHSRIQSDDGLS